jgi:hypothetical protein
MKSKKAEVFTYLMRQQNAEMKNTAAKAIFGYTPSVRQQLINIDGEETTVELALATTNEIIKIEATPSTRNLHKYLVIVKTENRRAIENTIREIFEKITGPLENQPANFPIPRCGGREKPIEQNNTASEKTTTMTSYMATLETFALAQNPQDAGPSEPPKRYRKITISYAGAVKAGILKDSNSSKLIKTPTTQEIETDNDNNTQDLTDTSSTQRQVSWDSNTTDTSRSIGSSLSRSMTNSKIQNFKKDIDMEIQELKGSLAKQMDQQDQRISEILQMMRAMNSNMETRIAQAVILAMVKEKSKVQEFTHGRIYDPLEAPLADEKGILPFGEKVESSGPLHRLHHVEVTVQHMAAVLDTIAEHLQQQQAARYLFHDDDGSETPTILELGQSETNRDIENEEKQHTDQDVPMTMLREYGGIKRLHGTAKSPSRNNGSQEVDPSSPQQTPPPKRERSDKNPPPNLTAKPGSGGQHNVPIGLSHQASETEQEKKQAIHSYADHNTIQKTKHHGNK